MVEQYPYDEHLMPPAERAAGANGWVLGRAHERNKFKHLVEHVLMLLRSHEIVEAEEQLQCYLDSSRLGPAK